jgi:hypothetical protein
MNNMTYMHGLRGLYYFMQCSSSIKYSRKMFLNTKKRLKNHKKYSQLMKLPNFFIAMLRRANHQILSRGIKSSPHIQFLQMCVSIILLYMCMIPKCYYPLWFSDLNLVQCSHHPNVCYTSHPFYLSLVGHSDNICWDIHNMKYFIMQYSPSYCCFPS